jgi:hypothetical protein
MVWRLSNTWAAPASKASLQRGYPAPGSGAQHTGADPRHAGAPTTREPVRPTKGLRSWFQPASPRGGQQGFPAPENPAQQRPPGTMPNRPLPYGLPIFTETPYYDRGAGAFVPNFGKTLTNPIGAGIVACHRPQPSYGESGQYHNGAIWWTPQVIPTSIPLIALNDPAALEAIVGPVNIQAMVRTTG